MESLDQLFGQMLQLIGQWGGMPWGAKVSAVILLVLASMKASALRPLWDKAGPFKVWFAPILGLAAGIISLAPSGELSAAGILAYVTAGAGAVILHELLDTLKAVPGLGPVWLMVIDLIKMALRAPPPPPPKV